MKGLILKDLLVLKKYSKTLLLMLGFYLLFSFFMSDMSFFSGMTVLFFTITTITSFSYDDLAKWDRYARSLPVTRREIVMSKYLFALILAAAGTVLSVIFSLVFMLFNQNVEISEQLITSYSIFAVAICFMCILLPLLFRFGVEKSRMMMFGVFLIPTIIILAISKLDIAPPTEEQIVTVIKLSPLILIILSAISLQISFCIYQNKE